jgi:FixJ family two-component response regulator
MPGMSGLELFDRLVERRPSLRVLFISGAASAADLDTIRHKGAVLLEKPFSAQALANKVREVLR